MTDPLKFRYYYLRTVTNPKYVEINLKQNVSYFFSMFLTSELTNTTPMYLINRSIFKHDCAGFLFQLLLRGI